MNFKHYKDKLDQYFCLTFLPKFPDSTADVFQSLKLSDIGVVLFRFQLEEFQKQHPYKHKHNAFFF